MGKWIFKYIYCYHSTSVLINDANAHKTVSLHLAIMIFNLQEFGKFLADNIHTLCIDLIYQEAPLTHMDLDDGVVA